VVFAIYCRKPEAVASDDSPIVNNDTAADTGVFPDRNLRIQFAVIADDRAMANVTMAAKHTAIADGDTRLNDAIRPQVNVLAELGVSGHDGGGMKGRRERNRRRRKPLPG